MTEHPSDSEFDFLFGGEEINTTVEQAAVRSAEELELDRTHATGPRRVTTPMDEPEPPSPAEEFPAVDVATTVVQPEVPSGGGLQVLSMPCPADHPNAADAKVCRYCGQPIAPGQPRMMARPQLGVLRFSSGQVVSLSSGLVVGRSPSADAEGGDPSRELVRVASPGNRISRSHVSVELDGWDVFVTDLHSGNGTTLVTPGQEPQQLEPGQRVALPVGSTIWLAKEVSFAYTVA